MGAGLVERGEDGHIDNRRNDHAAGDKDFTACMGHRYLRAIGPRRDVVAGVVLAETVCAIQPALDLAIAPFQMGTHLVEPGEILPRC